MGLFSIFRNNKQPPVSSERAFSPRTEEESKAVRTRSKRRTDDPVDDPELPEKKRARRRLVGAIALVLAMIIGLPMIFDSEPKPLAEDIAIQIPSKDKPASPESPAAASSGASAGVPNTPARAQANAPGDSTVAPAVTNGNGAPTRPLLGQAVEPATSASAEKGEAPLSGAAPGASATEKPATPTGAAKAEETARALAILEGKPDPKRSADMVPGDMKLAKFVVQVAALESQEKIRELQSKLSAAGINSFTQKVGTVSGPRTRIRIGPFGAKGDADKMCVRLAKLGLHGNVIPGSR